MACFFVKGAARAVSFPRGRAGPQRRALLRAALLSTQLRPPVAPSEVLRTGCRPGGLRGLVRGGLCPCPQGSRSCLCERSRVLLSRSGTRGASSLCGSDAVSGRPVAMATTFFHRDPRKPRGGPDRGQRVLVLLADAADGPRPGQGARSSCPQSGSRSPWVGVRRGASAWQ